MSTCLGCSESGEFCEAFELVKPNAGAGRVNIPRRRLCAVVERLPGREDEHVRDWAEFDDVSLVPKKGRYLESWLLETDLLVPSLFKLFEVCLWKVLDKELHKDVVAACRRSSTRMWSNGTIQPKARALRMRTFE